MGPSKASTNRITPSAIFNTRSTSPPKSAWPGVSITLIFTSLYVTEAFLLKMVIPRSFSRSLLSMIKSPVSWLSRKTLAVCKILSTRVVLPWSTWAIIAMFLIFIILFRGRKVKPFQAGGQVKLLLCPVEEHMVLPIRLALLINGFFQPMVRERHGRRTRESSDKNMTVVRWPQHQGEFSCGWDLLHFQVQQVNPAVSPAGNPIPVCRRNGRQGQYRPGANAMGEFNVGCNAMQQ